MPVFRKKPVEVEAVQFLPGENDDVMLAHLEGCVGWQMAGQSILIPTLEGDMLADPGDWIIREPFPTADRQFYPCKPDIFEATYDAIEALETTAAS